MHCRRCGGRMYLDPWDGCAHCLCGGQAQVVDGEMVWSGFAGDTVGNRIRQARASRGLRRLDVALLSGLSYKTIARVERGDDGYGTDRTVSAICQALGIEWTPN